VRLARLRLEHAADALPRRIRVVGRVFGQKLEDLGALLARCICPLSIHVCRRPG
jgi:hypothetical protein